MNKQKQFFNIMFFTYVGIFIMLLSITGREIYTAYYPEETMGFYKIRPRLSEFTGFFLAIVAAFVPIIMIRYPSRKIFILPSIIRILFENLFLTKNSFSSEIKEDVEVQKLMNGISKAEQEVTRKSKLREKTTLFLCFMHFCCALSLFIIGIKELPRGFGGVIPTLLFVSCAIYVVGDAAILWDKTALHLGFKKVRLFFRMLELEKQKKINSFYSDLKK